MSRLGGTWTAGFSRTASPGCGARIATRSTCSPFRARRGSCARRVVARCGSSRSSSTTMSWTRSCDTSRRPRRDLLAVHRARQLFPPLPEPISAAAAVCGGCARGGGNGVRDRGSRLLCQDKLSRPLVPTDSGGRSKRTSPLWSTKRLPSTVLAWGGTKGISFP